MAGEAGGAAAVGRGRQDPGQLMCAGETHNAGHGDQVGEKRGRKTITLSNWRGKAKPWVGALALPPRLRESFWNGTHSLILRRLRLMIFSARVSVHF